ncbi:Swt1 family HEPN domain-containing protein [Bifidobacterium vespertilionis]|uniref:ATP-binding protein n=1 Tax=Bifidobacterium vespertilionis TaxID=2562524 RepID=A0A5J5DYU7_9BIFI|nr:Swt1 family HEPN domain-containing protein [Bifidobacterium vespertilionis]KAA8822005.1 ATP-binding protein [Bifidobacterium vespertilionis]KAA8823554.1 ATP-binding protein [Bifidobacterium vespertilionis]
MAINNRDRVGKAFDFLSEGLVDPVDEVMTKVYGTLDWPDAWALAEQQKYGSPLRKMSKTDVQVQLHAITEYGRNFNDILSRAQQSYASELRETRNQWAHLEPFTSDEAIRALSTIELLLNAVNAPDSAADVRKLRDTLQRTVYEDHTRKVSQRKILSVDATQGMKPWREVIAPHEDVASGRFTASEFAANLYDVAVSKTACVPGNAYGDPVEFYNRTYLTEGLRDLLTRAIRRLVGDNSGSPVVNLQTNFGGGKTHSLLALYHMFGEKSVVDLSSDVQNLVAGLGIQAWAPGLVHRAAIVGTQLNVAKPSVKPDGTQVHTIWGELAWQLGGVEGYAMVAENDQAGKPPADSLDQLLRRYSPCLILVDEWVAYARQLVGRDDLPAGTFDDQFTFAQTLTEAAASVPHCMLVVSIPASEDGGKASNMEVGGENGQEALKRLQMIVRRKADQWRPSTRDESFEIVRKRLFEEPDAQAQAQIALTAKQFMAMYRAEPKSYPAEVTSSDYDKRIRSSYPLHPELLDRLYEDWSSLENFQRTRGVLTLVSSIIHELWASNDSSPLILSGNVPLDSETVYSNLAQYLPDSWKAIIDTDVSGPQSTAAQIDNDRPALGQRVLTQRVARTVFMGSAPRAGLPNRGLGVQHVWLGTAMPGDVPGNFGTAVSQLEQRSTYFFAEGSAYRYSLQPSITKTARDYAERLREDPASVYNEIVSRLQPEGLAGKRGKFRRVCIAPEGTDGIPDTDQATLVILHPRWTITKGESDTSEAKQWVRDAIEHRGSAQRSNRNMLVFLAADRSQLTFTEDAARSYLGWKRVADSEVQLNLTHQQIEQARNAMAGFDRTLNDRIRNAYCWCVYPEQIDARSAYRLSDVRIPDSGGDSMAQRTGSKLATDDMLVEHYASSSLGEDMRKYLLSAFTDGVLPVKTVWECITRFPYMPRLVDREVFDHAIEDAPSAMLTPDDRFAVASGRYESGHFQNLIVPGVTDTAQAVVQVTDSMLIVDWDTALADLEAVKAEREAESLLRIKEQPAEPAVRRPKHATPGSQPVEPADAVDPFREPAPARKRRYYATAELDPDWFSRDLARINEGILDQLKYAGASISLSLEIHAEMPGGFDDNTIRIIDASAKTLKLGNSGFEEE